MRPRQARLAEEFAAALEGGGALGAVRDPALAPLVRLALGLEALPLGPTPDFRDTLRTRLLAVAAVAEPATAPAPTFERAKTWVEGWRVQRSLAGAATAMTAVVLAAGVGTATSRSLPGDAFYGMKRTAEGVQLATARNDVNRGKRHLQHAETRLEEIEQLVGAEIALAPLAAGSPAGTTLALGGTVSDRVVATLRAMDEATRAGTELLTSAYERENATEPIDTLARFATRQRSRLWTVLPELPAEARDQATASYELVTAVEEEAGDILENETCGTACPPTDGPTALPVSEPTPTMTPTPTPEPQESPTASPEDTGGEPAPEPSPSTTPDPDPTPTPSPSPTEPDPSPSPSEPEPSPSPSPTRTILPSAVPSPVREPVEEVVDEVGRTLPTPTPAP